jgi:hypothetical protein
VASATAGNVVLPRGVVGVVVAVSVLVAGCTTGGSGQRTTATTGDDPRPGDELVSVVAVNESVAMRANASARAAFGNLTDDQQAVFREALECDCNVEQDAFHFDDKRRVEYVRYDGAWYFVRVSIV